MRRFLEAYKFGTFEINGQKFPKILVGTSPFIGAGQFGEKSYSYLKHFYERPQNITKLLIDSIKEGCNAVQVICYPPVIEAVENAVRDTKTEMFILGSAGVGSIYEEIDALRILGAKCIVCHGSYTDRDTDGDLEKLSKASPNLTIGIATHMPGITIEKAAMMDKVQVILAPVNKSGNFMRPSAERTMRAIKLARGRGKKIIAMKPLAAGTLAPEKAFAFLKDKVDGVAVGVASKGEISETLKAGRKYFGGDMA